MVREYIAISFLPALQDLYFANAWRRSHTLREPDDGELQAALVWAAMLEANPSINSVWEIGCGVGSSLLYLGQRFPSVSFVGTELNAAHVRRLNEAFQLRGVWNVKVCHAHKFHQAHDQKIDMVCSRGSLYYVPPGAMENLIEDIRAVDPKLLVLCEPSYANGVTGWREWVSNKISYAYDYGEIFQGLWPEVQVSQLKWVEGKPPGVLLTRGSMVTRLE